MPALIRATRFLLCSSLVLPALLVVPACTSTKYEPPAPSTSRAATPVNASKGRTWDAVIDVFAERNIPIRNMERASGFIVTEDLGISDPDSVSVKWADCGTTKLYYRTAKKKGQAAAAGSRLLIPPTKAAYNILVRGDSSRSTVKVTVRWTAAVTATTPSTDCTTKGKWEVEAENDIKHRAESEASVSPAGRPTETTAARSGQPVPPGTRWVADATTHTYYPTDCAAVTKIAPADRLYYGSEGALRSAGFKRSQEC